MIDAGADVPINLPLTAGSERERVVDRRERRAGDEPSGRRVVDVGQLREQLGIGDRAFGPVVENDRPARRYSEDR